MSYHFSLEDPSQKVVEIKRRWCDKRPGTTNHGPYEVDDRLNIVTCKTCGVEMSPMHVLLEISRWEERMKIRCDTLRKRCEEADQRNRTKCEHCGNMTRVVKK